MEESTVTYIVAPIVSAVLGGLAWLVKRYFNGRDADKQEMKNDIENLKADVKKTNKKLNDLTGAIMSCEHPDCPTRKKWAALMQEEE